MARQSRVKISAAAFESVIERRTVHAFYHRNFASGY